MYKVGVYIRLSKEDSNKKEESESIINQRNLIKSYLKRNNLEIESEYVDDGYSGTSFDRPAFNKMISDIENKKINMVITKDLSRLGRDYIQSGYYLEQYFPLKKVRYVSILDNIDTSIDSTNNDIAPFKSLFNDMQSKDTSRKIRSILRNKKEQGLFLGSSSSYGYKKSIHDKHKLVIDEYASIIVKKIFTLAVNGKSNKEICEILNKDNIKTPIEYKNNTYNNKKWSPSTIHNILSNRIYTGDMVQGTQAKLSYKSKKRIFLSSNQWIIVENSHEPIISKEVFELVNKNKTRTKTKRNKLLLEGLIYCNECNSILGVRVDGRNKNNIHHTINCNNFLRHKSCTSHFMIYQTLEKEILKTINTKLSNVDINKITERISFNKNSCTNKDKINELNNRLISIYEDKCKGIIDDDMYKILCKRIEEQKKYISIEDDDKKNNSINKLEINNNLIKMLINKITISNDKTVRIYYNFNDVK